MTFSKVGMSGSADECAAVIREARRVLVIGHVDPDGDAIGSLFGLGWLLQALDIAHVLACDSPVPARWSFLPQTGPIVAECADDHDLIVAVDCNARARMGRFSSHPELDGVPIVNIDHHVTNTLFGTVNWVDDGAAATAEMIYALAALFGVALSEEAATCLLTGIVTDTQAFRTPNTTSRTMEIALQTMNAGATLGDIVAQTVDCRGFASMCLWARVIDQVQLNGEVIWAEVSRADLQACDTGRDAKGGLVNFLLTAKEAKVVVLLAETAEEIVDVSMRSMPDLDVSAAAVRLGGGGHPQAAGCTLNVPIVEARASVCSVLKQSLAEQGLNWPGIGVSH
jgi:phosphoesterase RecJ-like protein